MFQLVGKQREPARVDVGGGDRHGRRFHLVLTQKAKELVDAIGNPEPGLARRVVGREIRKLGHALTFHAR